jgi:hypothetical protein
MIGQLPLRAKAAFAPISGFQANGKTSKTRCHNRCCKFKLRREPKRISSISDLVREVESLVEGSAKTHREPTNPERRTPNPEPRFENRWPADKKGASRLNYVPQML